MPNERVRPLVLDAFVPYRLSVLTNRVSDAIAAHYEDRFGLTIPEWRVMAALGDTPDLSAREVATRTAMDKVQVSRAVASLMAARRVQRTPSEADGRVAHLALTRAGRAVYEEIVPLALHLEETLLSVLTGEERRTLHRLMDKLATQTQKLEPGRKAEPA
ncbi:MAG: winged helix-turn-helix transcriptional regulator [Alphaproteobacteria bacterium]|nr:winged helix-turn-helix transcriptional regulator [Alphaproteobacteria bacterium]MDE1987792.1 winged helix-turn-helix transcriptional regulator [Alphaproteobacteria bacterium]MDE2164518.1 winged helix-turn-helix transcriptional regulator [Alphaproteobacteria bacterium]MDE2266755.1 winged helix-turn-helix transcriptional regulator [Alphaproteobacteria bacterium]MDE2500412.1 winged helix-turn-helix transcriptional regulator [Alphaproteobacteria bacterium]